MARGNYKAEEAAREERRKKVVANLLAGMSTGDIAQALSVGKTTVYNDINHMVERWKQEQVDKIETQRMLDIRRLDRVINTIWGDILDGKLQAIDRLLKLMERRAKLLGLDRPDKIASTTPDGDKAYTPPTESDVPENYGDTVAKLLAAYGQMVEQKESEPRLAGSQ